jgi:hypothetical protein
MDPKLFSSWVHRLVVLLKRRFGRQTSSRWRRFSQKNVWIVQVVLQQAIKAIPVLSTRKIVSRRQELGVLGVGMALFTTALAALDARSLRRCVVVVVVVVEPAASGELQGFIIHEAVPTGDPRSY